MSWQDLQWADIEYDAVYMHLPDPQPITPRPLHPHVNKDQQTKRRLQLLALSMCSALCFIIGLILVLNAGTSQIVKMIAVLFGILWFLLLMAFVGIKASLERQVQQYEKAVKKWIEWERRAYKAGLKPQQRQSLENLLYPEDMAARQHQAVKEENMLEKVRAREDIRVRIQNQGSE